jgi:hypothetical protein
MMLLCPGRANRFGGFFDGGSPIGFLRLLGSFMGDFLGDGGSFLSAGVFVFSVRI